MSNREFRRYEAVVLSAEQVASQIRPPISSQGFLKRVEKGELPKPDGLYRGGRPDNPTDYEGWTPGMIPVIQRKWEQLRKETAAK